MPHLSESTKPATQFVVTDQKSQAEGDRAAWRMLTPEERMDAVETLREQAGKFRYEYPTRLRTLLTVTRSPSR